MFPRVCENLNTDHSPLIELYRKARALPGIKKVLIGSGVRYDLAIESPEYVRELAQHHVGGYLKIAPEHVREGPLDKMMKPGVGTYHRFKELFDNTEGGGKEQTDFLLIAAAPGQREDMPSCIWRRRRLSRDKVKASGLPHASAKAMFTAARTLRRVNAPAGSAIPRGWPAPPARLSCDTTTRTMARAA